MADDRGRLLGKELLVPLTSSLYVPGKLTDVESVVVDVGTGYYVKKVCPLPQLILTSSLDTNRHTSIF